MVMRRVPVHKLGGLPREDQTTIPVPTSLPMEFNELEGEQAVDVYTQLEVIAWVQDLPTDVQFLYERYGMQYH